MDVDDNVYVDEKAFTDVAEKKSKKKKVLLITLITFLTLLIAGYFVMVYIASRRFNPGTIIDGKDMSFKTVDEASELIKEDYKDYERDRAILQIVNESELGEDGLPIIGEKCLEKINLPYSKY